MGWDITYHPFRAQEAGDIYFRCLDDPDHYRSVARTFALQEEPTEQLGRLLDSIRKEIAKTEEKPSGRFHIFAMAAVAGFLRKYWYVRGSALSFLPHEILEKYITDWSELIPVDRATGPWTSRLEENYAGGVYLAPEALRRLRDDYATSDTLRTHFDNLFSHGRLAVFWQAVDFAVEHNVGMIEASEVVEVNPLDLNQSSSSSLLPNCQTEGALLYAEAAVEQMHEVQKVIKHHGPATASATIGQQSLPKRPAKIGMATWIFLMMGLLGLIKSCIHAERKYQAEQLAEFEQCRDSLGIPPGAFSREDQPRVIAQLNDKANPLNQPGAELYKCRSVAKFYSNIDFSNAASSVPEYATSGAGPARERIAK